MHRIIVLRNEKPPRMLSNLSSQVEGVRVVATMWSGTSEWQAAATKSEEEAAVLGLGARSLVQRPSALTAVLELQLGARTPKGVKPSGVGC